MEIPMEFLELPAGHSMSSSLFFIFVNKISHSMFELMIF